MTRLSTRNFRRWNPKFPRTGLVSRARPRTILGNRTTFSILVSTIRQKIAYNVTFSGAARIIDTFLALVITGLLTRYLGPSGFGDYIIIFTFWYIFTVLADLGLYSITVKEISQNDGEEQKIISNAFTLRMVSTALIFFVGILAVFLFPYKNTVKIGVIIASIGFWALFSEQVLMGLFQKNLRIDRAALGDLAGRLVQVALTLVIIKKNLSFLSIIAAFSLSGLASLAVYVWFARRFVNLKLAADFEVWKKILRQGWPLALSAILTMLYFRLNVITLSLIKGEEAVGIFGVGYKILENLIFFPAMFVGLVMPMMSRAAKTDMEKFKDILHKVSNALAIFLFPMVAATVILRKEIVQTIAGSGFNESAGVLEILIFATALIFLGTLFSNAIIALNKQKQLFRIYFWGAVLNFIINIVLIPPLSYMGAAWSTLATEFLVTALMMIYLWREIKYLPRLPRLPKIILSTVISSIGILFIGKEFAGKSPAVLLVFLLPLEIALYFAVLYMTGGIKKEEFKLFFNRW